MAIGGHPEMPCQELVELITELAAASESRCGCNATTRIETTLTMGGGPRPPTYGTHDAGGAANSQLGGAAMRQAILLAFVMYVFISGGGATSGPFNSNVDCESHRVNQAAFGYCVPLWQ
jgi:hypothetical protein